MSTLTTAITMATASVAVAGGVLVATPIFDEVELALMTDKALTKTELNSLYKLQDNMDLLADIQGKEKFDLKLDEIVSIRDSKSISEAANKFDNIMSSMSSDITFKDTYCTKIESLTVQEVNNYLVSDISEEQKDLIRECIK